MGTRPTQAHETDANRASIEAQLEEMRRRLLDLTGRNRLLNFRHSPGRAIPFVEANLDGAFDRLANGQPLEVTALPEPGPRDMVEQAGRMVRPEPAEWAAKRGITTSYEIRETFPDEALRALHYRDVVASRCRNLDRLARLAIEETGANMLFLAIGFLDFPSRPQSEEIYSAPLVCWPVRLRRRPGMGEQRWLVEPTGEEMSENLSLKQKLDEDHDLGLPSPPEPEGGNAALDKYFAAVSQTIRVRQKIAIRRRVTLCMLSFANMLLFRDLEPQKWVQGNGNGLTDHALVSGILSGGFGRETAASTLVEHEVEGAPASEMPLVFDADSSQHDALVDVLEDCRNIVVEGPPGTGKSQTITNLIAAAINQGKKVLFLAEKRAALEVVRQRLDRAGLLPFVLELHSNRSSTAEVLGGLRSRLKHRAAPPRHLQEKLAQVEKTRRQLRAYSAVLNSVLGNRLGLTVHQMIWRLESHRALLGGKERGLALLSVNGAPAMAQSELLERLDALHRLVRDWYEVGPWGPRCAFWGFLPKAYLPGDEHAIAAELSAAEIWARRAERHAERLVRATGAKRLGLGPVAARAHLAALDAIQASLDPALPLHLIPAMARTPGAAEELRALKETIACYRAHGEKVALGLAREEPPSAESLAAVRRLDNLLSAVGASDFSCSAMEGRAGAIEHCAGQLASAWLGMKDVLATLGTCSEGNRPGIDKAAGLGALADTCPEPRLHLQTSALTEPESAPALEDLSLIQSELVAAESGLSARLYLDAVPAETELRAALNALRRAAGWLRFFRRDYRSARSLYRSLQQHQKAKTDDRQRLDDLEALLRLSALRAQWQGAPGRRFLNAEARTVSTDIGPYIAIARWNAAVRSTFQASALEPPALGTPELAFALLRALRRLQRSAGITLAALGELERMGLSRPPGSAADSDPASLQQWLTDLADSMRHVAGIAAAIAAPSATLATFAAGLEAAASRVRIRENVATMRPEFLGREFRGVETDIDALLKALEIAKQIENSDLHPQIRAYLVAHPPIRTCKLIGGRLRMLAEGFEGSAILGASLSKFGTFEPAEWAGARQEEDIAAFWLGFARRLLRVRGHEAEIHRWADFVESWQSAERLGLAKLIQACDAEGIAPNAWPDAYQACAFRDMLREAYRAAPELRHFGKQAAADFREADKAVIELRGAAIASQCLRAACPPAGERGARVGELTEMELIEHVLAQQRPRLRLRELMFRAGKATQELKPCFMMSPQSVAQYLPREQAFDLVVMDEASQLRPEEAFGAVARGGQLVVVGDPNQLPPTPFFTRMAQEEAEGFTATDAESILDLCAGILPKRGLRWHYRSKHESLIAFSNRHFYDGRLVVLPSPYGQGVGLGVSAVYLRDSVYENQKNLREAVRVTELVVEHARTRPDESLGVITLNSQQCQLIEDLLDKREADPALEGYCREWAKRGERLIVKNLENMQGDERDAVIISTTFGKPPDAAVVRQNFGPISRDNGWRRLNVLFTRARRSVTLVTSLRAEDIVTDAATPRGTRTFKAYLAFAQAGMQEVPLETGAAAESEFEAAVGSMLLRRGFGITPQLGVAGYRIDIAVRHPDYPGAYLAAIECDGATYHAARSVRDRDRIRQEILESLGWEGRIWRIWSTEWFRNPGGESERLLRFLQELRQAWVPEHRVSQRWTEEGANAPVPAGVAEPPTGQQEEAELEVSVGDTVRYSSVLSLDEVLCVNIARDRSDRGAGVIAQGAPLAQCLLGAVRGDEVVLRLPGERPKTFRVIEIVRPPSFTP